MSLTILVPRDFSIMEKLKSLIAPGRPVGVGAAGYIDDLATLGKTIVLCEDCFGSGPNGKGWFEWSKHGYYSIWKYEQTPVDGICDKCKVDGHDRRLFIKEEFVPQCWLTKDEQRRRATGTIRIGRH